MRGCAWVQKRRRRGRGGGRHRSHHGRLPQRGSDAARLLCRPAGGLLRRPEALPGARVPSGPRLGALGLLGARLGSGAAGAAGRPQEPVDGRVEERPEDTPDPGRHPKQGRGDDGQHDGQLAPGRGLLHVPVPDPRPVAAEVAEEHAGEGVQDVVRQGPRAVARDDGPLLARRDVQGGADAEGLRDRHSQADEELQAAASEVVARDVVQPVQFPPVVPDLPVGAPRDVVVPGLARHDGDPGEEQQHGQPRGPAPPAVPEVPPALLRHGPEAEEREPAEDLVHIQGPRAAVRGVKLEGHEGGAADPGARQGVLQAPPEGQHQPPEDEVQEVPQVPVGIHPVLGLPLHAARLAVLRVLGSVAADDPPVEGRLPPPSGPDGQREPEELREEVDGGDLDDAVHLAHLREVRRRTVARDEDVRGHHEGEHRLMVPRAESPNANKDPERVRAHNAHGQEELRVVQDVIALLGCTLGVCRAGLACLRCRVLSSRGRRSVRRR
mmetsp:Transcript_57328/g.173321  ORF Transcript_57328/g.173321 Transcript_57328/m.173321 type:complete len:495 (+) Transcript_57328:227-1711(+)